MWLIELMNTHNQINNSLMMMFEYISMMSCMLVMLSRNAMMSMMYLMLLYVNVSMYLFYTGLGVMGLLYMLVYVGAMAMLFLFMLSLINIKMSELATNNYKQDMLLMLMTMMSLFYILMYYNINTNMLPNTSSVDMYNMLNISWNDMSSYSELKIIGELLYTQYSMTMLIIGLMLLLAIIGVIIITK